MPAYITIDYFKRIATMPPASVDLVESLYPGAFSSYAESVSRRIDSMLAKRYKTPFDPVPEAVQFYVAHIVAYHMWNKLGHDATENKDDSIKEMKDEAEAYFRGASDAEASFVELPRRDSDTTDASSVVRHGPLCSSEWSPYAWTDRQRRAVRGSR